MRKYGHHNFCLAIIEIVRDSKLVLRNELLKREQYYLDIVFALSKDMFLNLVPTAGITAGFKHTEKFKNNRTKTLCMVENYLQNF